MCLFDLFSDDSHNERKKGLDRRLEEEMDYYGLDEDEKELVRSGEYEPWDFDYPGDSDLDEEDYYSEDDDF